MTPRSPSHGTTLSSGRIENSPARTELIQTSGLSAFLDAFRPRWLREFVTIITLLLAALAGCGQRNYSNHVELVTSCSTPAPAMTFELRFESAMARGDQVGLAATNSPLVITPSLAGSFIWLSTRSGVFTPSESLALDTTYKLSLAPGLTQADGRPAEAGLAWKVTTPPFGVIAAWPQQANTSASSEPEIKFAFNADVQAADAERFVFFRDVAGQRVAADVRQGMVDDRWTS